MEEVAAKCKAGDAQSHYRSIFIPLTKFVDTIEHKASEENYRVTVMIPQFIPKKAGIIFSIINQV